MQTAQHCPNVTLMKYKMLVLDLDDTLLRDDYSISARNREALMRAQEKGVKVVLASGRPTPAMLKFADELNLAKFQSYMISFNGAVITDLAQNKIIFNQSLTQKEIHQLHDFSKKHNVDIITYLEESIVSERISEYIDVEIKLTGMSHKQVSCFKSAVTAPAVKCIMLEEPNYLKGVEQKLKTECPDLSVSISKPFFLEITPNGIDKAASIRFLADHLGIAKDQIIAVGNAGNDLSMVQYAGLGVWVDNVDDSLRHYADVVVASNMNDGVAEVVDKHLGI